MNLISISEFKKLTVADIKRDMPFHLLADGVVFAVVKQVEKVLPSPAVIKQRTKCPNCKMEYDVTPPDGRPGFFTMKHPKG